MGIFRVLEGVGSFFPIVGTFPGRFSNRWKTPGRACGGAWPDGHAVRLLVFIGIMLCAGRGFAAWVGNEFVNPSAASSMYPWTRVVVYYDIYQAYSWADVNHAATHIQWTYDNSTWISTNVESEGTGAANNWRVKGHLAAPGRSRTAGNMYFTFEGQDKNSTTDWRDSNYGLSSMYNNDANNVQWSTNGSYHSPSDTLDGRTQKYRAVISNMTTAANTMSEDDTMIIAVRAYKEDLTGISLRYTGNWTGSAMTYATGWDYNNDSVYNSAYTVEFWTNAITAAILESAGAITGKTSTILYNFAYKDGSGTNYLKSSGMQSSSSGGTDYSFTITISTPGNPSGQGAVTNTSNPSSQIDLSWTKNSGKNVMVVRSTDSSFTAPTDGVAYTAGSSTIGGDPVIYNGSGTSFTDTSLSANTTYYYKYYSENYRVYSTGVTAEESTAPVAPPQAKNPGSANPTTAFLGDKKALAVDASTTWNGNNRSALTLFFKNGSSDLTSGTSETNNEAPGTASGDISVTNQFKATGTYYWALRVSYQTGNNYYYWQNTSSYLDMSESLPSEATQSIVVGALNNPSGQGAVTNTSNPASQMNLTWSKNAQAHPVMIVRKTSAQSWTEPTQGTAYSVSGSIGAGVVVYHGSDTSFTDTGLTGDTTYDYKFYSVNNSYYSAGVTAQEATEKYPAPSAATATADGNTMMDLAWTKNASYDVMIVHRAGSASTAPTLGTSYSVGESCGSGTVIYKGSGANLEHVVTSGTTHYYAFYSYSGSSYSTGLTASASVDSFRSGEIVETFSYTSGVALSTWCAGSNGWGAAWYGNTAAFTNNSGNFTAQTNYPTPTGNKVLTTPFAAGSSAIFRHLGQSYNSGRIYFGYTLNYAFGGSVTDYKYSGLSLCWSNSEEKLFVGEISAADQMFGIDTTSSGSSLTAGSGNDYIIAGYYDWSTGYAYATAYKISTESVPVVEPTAWDISLAKASNTVGWVNTIRLASGASVGTPGNTYFDEVRIATNWAGLIGYTPGTPLDPANGAASAHGTYPGTAFTLTWNEWSNKPVMVAYSTNASAAGVPTDGNAYAAGNTFGNWTVLTGSDDDETVEATGLQPNTAYYFKLYSINCNYYSTGAVINGKTAMPQSRNYAGNDAPRQPSVLYLGDTGDAGAFGCRSWGNVSSGYSATGWYVRIKKSDGNLAAGYTEGSSGGSGSSSDKTATAPRFTSTGTWYWGMRVDYGVYGNWYYLADQDAYTNMSPTGGVATLTVTVSALNTPSGQSAAVSSTQSLSQIDLAWTRGVSGIAKDTLILRKTSAITTAPTQGQSYSVNDVIDGATVIYKGSGTSCSDTGLENDTTYYYAFYAENYSYYSEGVTAGAQTDPDPDTAVCEPFDYTAGTQLIDDNGGSGWSGSWSALNNSGAFSNAAASLTAPVNYDAVSGGKVQVNANTGAAYQITRTFSARSTGTVYAAALMQFSFPSTNKWVGFSLMNGSSECAFVGKINSRSGFLGLDSYGTASDNSTYMPTAYALNTNSTYLVILRYVFSTRTLSAKAYYCADTLPEQEPATWDASVVLTNGRISSVNGIMLNAGGGSSAAYPGLCYYDEVRVAGAWYELLGQESPAAMQVLGNDGAQIANGSASASSAAGTDFGKVNVSSPDASVTRTFLITNVGPGNLTIDTVSLSGTASGDFSVLQTAPFTVTPNTVSNLTITFNPASYGTRQAWITLDNDSLDTDPYQFVIQGSGTGTIGAITVDGDPSDWPGVPGSMINASVFAGPEFIWNDQLNEMRRDPGADSDLESNLDFDDLHVCADSTNIYLLIAMRDITNATYSAIGIGVTTNLHPTESSGTFTWLGADSDLAIGGGYYSNNTASMHYPIRNIMIHTVSGTPRVQLYAGGQWYEPPNGWAAVISTTSDVLEVAINRADLMLTGPVTGRFTFASFQGTDADCNGGASTYDFSYNDAIDTISIAPYGVNDPNMSLTAWEQGPLGQDKIDFFMDIPFDDSGVDAPAIPSAPALSAPADGAGVEGGSPWLQWSAPASSTLPITGYLIEMSTNDLAGSFNASIPYRYNVAYDARSNKISTVEQTLYWRVWARDASGQLSNPSEVRYWTASGDSDVNGPEPTLLYVGTNVNGFLAGNEAGKAEVLDADMANGTVSMDFAVQFFDGSGVYYSNSANNTYLNIGSENGRVIPNWDILESNLTTGATTDWGKDMPFTCTNTVAPSGYGSTYVTSFWHQAFSITNYNTNIIYYLTLSSEDCDANGNWSNSVSSNIDGYNTDRTVRTNALVQIQVTDDDNVAPRLWYWTDERSLIITNAASGWSWTDTGTNVIYETTDGSIHANGLELRFNVYDSYSGIRRATSGGTSTNMNITIGSWKVSDLAGYTASGVNSNNTTVPSSLTRWAFSGLTKDDVSALCDDGDMTTAVSAIVPDSDADRADDWLALESLFGYLKVTDDDAVTPQFGADGLRIYYSAGRTNITPVGNVYSIRLDELTQVGAGDPLRFVVNAYDAFSGLQRGSSGTAGTNCTLSVGSWLSADIAGYDATESDDVTTGSAASNTWKYSSLAATNIAALFNARTNEVTFVFRDGDNDRNSDQLAVTNSAAWKLAVTMPQSQNRGSFTMPTIYLGDTGVAFEAETRVMLPTADRARLWISQTTNLTSGKAGGWADGVSVEAKSAVSHQFSATGTWYWGMQIDSGDYGTNFWHTASQAVWSAMSDHGSSAALSVAVLPLTPPSGLTAALQNGNTQVKLDWTRFAARTNVMVVYNRTNAPAAPVNGTHYAVNDTVASDGTRVIYRGALETYTHTPAAIDGEANRYAVYTENNGYYSAAVSTNIISTNAIWTGKGGAGAAAWNTAGNWSIGEVPPENQCAVFYRTDDNGAAITLSDERTYYTVLFNAAAEEGLTISGGGSLTLGAGGVNVASGSGAHTLNVPVVMDAAQTWSIEEPFELGGVLSGSQTLIKSGSGMLVLTATNTYSGGTRITAGTLQCATYSLSGPVTNQGTLTFDQAADGTWSSVISGGGSLSKSGTGSVTLTGNNTWTGKTTISAGTLRINADTRLGTAPGAYVADQLVMNGGELEIYNAITLPANRGITLSSGGGTFATDVTGTQTVRVESIVTGSGGLTKQGAGTLTLASNVSHSGHTRIESGKLIVEKTISNASPLVVASGAEALVRGFAGAFTNAGTITPGFNASTGMLTCSSLNMKGGAQINFAIQSTGADLIQVTGSAVLENDGPITLNITNSGGGSLFREIKVIGIDGAASGTPDWTITGDIPAGMSSLLSMTNKSDGWYLTGGQKLDCSITNANRGVPDLVVKMQAQTVSGMEYDLIYTDAEVYGDFLSNSWQFASRLTASSDTSVFTNNLATLNTNYLRFFRISPMASWSNSSGRFASAEIYVAKRVQIHAGRNWVALPCMPQNPSYSNVFGYSLPGSVTKASATYVDLYGLSGVSLVETSSVYFTGSHWYSDTLKQNVDGMALPLEQGFMVNLPSGPDWEFSVIGALRTNSQEFAIAGPNRLSFISVLLPSTMHPSNLNLTACGFLGASRLNKSDELYVWDRIEQRLKSYAGGSPQWMWFKTTDQTWRWSDGNLVTGAPIGQDDALIIYRRSGSSWTWTNTVNYSVPTREMTP